MFFRCIFFFLFFIPFAASASEYVSAIDYSTGETRYCIKGAFIAEEGDLYGPYTPVGSKVIFHGKYYEYYAPMHSRSYLASDIRSDIPNDNTDTDGDGLADKYDPCPDTSDSNLSVYRAKNTQTGSYYFFQITGDCGQTLTFINPIYDSLDSAAQAWALDPSPTGSADRTAMNPQAFQSWMDDHSGVVANPTSTPPNIDPSTPDPTGSDTAQTVPPIPQNNDQNTQDIINQIERMKVSIDTSINNSANKIANQVDLTGKQIVAALKGISGGGTSVSMTGVESLLRDIRGSISSGDSDIIEALSGIEEAISDLGDSSGGSTNGTGAGSTNGTGDDAPGTPLDILETFNGTIDHVADDRVEASRLRFLSAWQDLKSMFLDVLRLNLSGSGRLPTWTWSMLGQTVVIDFNDFATELNWFGLAFLFLATVSSVFLVISK